jgi:hypothetical protein
MPALDARSLYSPISFEDLPRKRSVDASLDVIKQNDRNNSLDVSAISKRNGSLDLISSPFRPVDKQVDFSPHTDIQVNFLKASRDIHENETSKVRFAEGSKKGFEEDGKGFLGEEKSSLCQIL